MAIQLGPTSLSFTASSFSAFASATPRCRSRRCSPPSSFSRSATLLQSSSSSGWTPKCSSPACRGACAIPYAPASAISALLRGGAHRLVLRGLQSLQPRHRRRRPLRRHRLRHAKRREQLRIGAYPAGRAAYQGGRSGRGGRRGRLCPQDQRAFDRDRDLRRRQCADPQFVLHQREGEELDAQEQRRPRDDPCERRHMAPIRAK